MLEVRIISKPQLSLKTTDGYDTKSLQSHSQLNSLLSRRSMKKWQTRKLKKYIRIVNNKLKFYTYKLQKVHFLNDYIKIHRLEKCKTFKLRYAKNRQCNILFTHGRVFTVEERFNKQNIRDICKDVQTANYSSNNVTCSDAQQL